MPNPNTYLAQFARFIITNKDHEYCKKLIRKGFKLFIVTNQAGIGKGIFSETTYKKFTKEIRNFFLKKKIIFSKISYCPYHPDAKIKKFKKKSKFRKPGNLMIEEIKKKWNIDLKKSFMIGDKKSDKKAAIKSSLKFYYAEKNFYKQIKKISSLLVIYIKLCLTALKFI